MTLRLLFSSRGLIGALFLASVISAFASRGIGQDKPPSREQQITDTQKQIDALNKKLEELRAGAKTSATQATSPAPLNPEWITALTWRCIGPASMGGRIVAISVFEADPSTYFVATASGGLLKTVNNGVTFEHQFDHEATVSIGDVAVAPSDRNVVWVGTGEANPRNSVSYGDGVYKSVDGGKTWKNMGLKKSFQIGRIAIHPKDPNIVYVGALGRLYGPNEERGLFKTTDGGKTWQKVLYVNDKTGVNDVQINPSEPDSVLVATYERQRDIYDSHPGEEPVQDGYDRYDPIKKWGPGSGLYKTTDGGKTFKQLTKGLPTVNLGRIGIDYYRKNPKTVYAVIESEKIGMGPPQTEPAAGGGYLGVQGEDADAGARMTRVLEKGPAELAGLKQGDIVLAVDGKPVLAYRHFLDQVTPKKPGDKITLRVSRNREPKDMPITLGTRPAESALQGRQAASATRPFGFMYSGQRENAQDRQGKDGFQYGGVYKSTDGGESWTRINSVNPRPMYFSQIRVDPSDERYLYVLGVALYRSQDGGKSFKPDGSREVHPDQHALWIDPRDGRHMIVGGDGGFYATYDRMQNWDHLNNQAIGQFYHVAVDSRRPYHVYGGLQDNGSWGGPSHSLRGAGPINEDWIVLGGGDGFVCRVDPNDPDVVYSESQDGFMVRRNLHTGEFAALRPPPPKVERVRIDARAAALLALFKAPVAPAGLHVEPVEVPYRFNWNAPFILSSHNPSIFYCAGNHVFRSVKRGDELRVISPEITRTKRGSGTAVAESPRNPDVLWAGTDDGNLWVTQDGGVKWVNVWAKVGLPGPRWVASIEPSRYAEGRAYVVFDAHRCDDDEPYVFVTEDFGQTWKPLRGNLPVGSTRVLREDIQNANLLFLGTEFAAWVSLDRGQSWARLNNNLPTVAVHEFAIHPTAGEIVAATHGRSLWVLDVSALRQMTPEVLKAKAYLYEATPGVHWRSEPRILSIYGHGSRRFVGQNPPRGAVIYYSLNQPAQKATLRLLDFGGKMVRELQADGKPGLHRAIWSMTRPAPRPAGQGAVPRQGGPGAFERQAPVTPGMYRIQLLVDGQEFSQSVRVDPDPNVPTFVVSPDGDNEADRDMDDDGEEGSARDDG